MARPRKQVLILSASEMCASVMSYAVTTQPGFTGVKLQSADEVAARAKHEHFGCVVVIRSTYEDEAFQRSLKALPGTLVEMRCFDKHGALEPLPNAVPAERDNVAAALEQIKRLCTKKRGPKGVDHA